MRVPLRLALLVLAFEACAPAEGEDDGRTLDSEIATDVAGDSTLDIGESGDDQLQPDADSLGAPDVVAPDSSPDSEPGDTATADSGSAEVVATGGPYHLTLGGWTMQPGQETTRCVIVRLGNTGPIWVPRIHTRLARGSHHFVIYRTNADVERREPFPCSPFSEALGGATVPLAISQVPEESIALPEGVAFELAPNQMIRLEAHFLNYYLEPLVAEASVTFDTLETDEPPIIADFLFYGTTAIHLPPGETVTNPWSFLEVPPGLRVFALTGHTHALGTNVEVETATSSGAGTPVYPPPDKAFRWSEAPVAFFAPPLEFADGDGFRFRCTWTNTTSSPVGFGESATREMCFFWGYYYPSRGFLVRF